MNPVLIKNKSARWFVYGAGIVALAIFYSGRSFSLGSDNGFDLENSLVPVDEIHHGGPPRDGIASIDEPVFIKAAAAKFLKSEDRVLGLVYEGVVRAYPIKILNYHEIVNDKIKGQPIVISYCPLCGSGMAFKPELSAADNSFGVSGLLYNSDMLLYDRLTESLWSQIMSKAVSGKLRGSKLTTLPLMTTSWQQWRQQYPDTEVLSDNTGHQRNYDNHPYGSYDSTYAIYFPVAKMSARYHPKERVIGLVIGDKTKAWPVSELSKQGQAVIKDTFNGQNLIIHYDDESQSAVVYDSQYKTMASINLFWFAWIAFHPETEVYTATKKNSK